MSFLTDRMNREPGLNNRKAKYTTLTELSAAFKSGELDSSYYLMIDKGGNSLTLCQYVVDSGKTEEQLDAEYEDRQKIFSREYGNPVEELLKLAGINSEWC